MCAMVYDETQSGNTIVGVLPNHTVAEQAIGELKANGFTADDISAITRMPEDAVAVEETTGVPTDALEGNDGGGKGALTGALGGGSLGATLGWVMAGGLAFLIPVAGPLTVAGALAATVTGALVGGTVGSVASALADNGVSEHEAGRLEQEIKDGKTVVMVTVASDEEAENATLIFERYESGRPSRFNARPTAVAETPVVPTAEYMPVGEQPIVATPAQAYTPVTERTTTTTTTTERETPLEYTTNPTEVQPRAEGNRPASTVTPETDPAYDTNTTREIRTERVVQDAPTRPMTYDEGTAVRPSDYSTLPDETQGSSTRGGIYNEPPAPTPPYEEPLTTPEPRPIDPGFNPPRDKGPQI